MDVIVWVTSKLQGDWSAPAIANQLTESRLKDLVDKFSKLDPMVRVRVLLACLFIPKSDMEQLGVYAQRLAEMAREDDDEWVRTIGRAVGNFDGRLDTEAVLKGSAVVRETMRSLEKLLPLMQAPPSFLPLEERFLYPELRTCPPQPHNTAHGHFTVRDTADASEALARIEAPGAGALSGSGAGAGGATPSVHARRGMGLSESGMFRSSRPEIGRVGTSASAFATSRPPAIAPPTPVVGSAPATASSLGTPSTSFGGRGVRLKSLDMHEVISLNQERRGSKRDASGGVLPPSTSTPQPAQKQSLEQSLEHAGGSGPALETLQEEAEEDMGGEGEMEEEPSEEEL